MRAWANSRTARATNERHDPEDIWAGDDDCGAAHEPEDAEAALRETLRVLGLARSGDDDQALTRDFRDTVAARARHDPEFRAAIIEEALQALLDGDLEDARTILRDCIV